MKKIDKLVLKNFKFFNGEKILDLNNNNILLYGENGSGKSSIYWALYTLLQSSIKKTDEEKTRLLKYFDKNDTDTLVNRYTEDDDTAFISVKLNDSTEYKVALEGTNTNLDDTTIYEAFTVSDFINYKLLAKNFDFKHSENLDIFEFLEKNIFDDIFTEDKTITFGKWWEKISSVYTLKGNANKYNNVGELEVDINLFFEALKNYLYSITEDIDTILKQYFKLNITITFEPKLDIKLLNKYRQVTRLDGKDTQQTTYYAKFPWIYLQIEYDEHVKEESDKYINRPHTYLNEAKLSAIALSIRFSMLRKKATADDILKILVLDDLLVSLDMSNRDMMLNMIIEDDFLQDYQIIMLTHDKAFFEMAKQKFNYKQKKQWKYFEMYVDSRGGFEKPLICKESLSHLEKADKYLCLNEYEVAGNFLRKEAESFCKDFLSKNNLSTFDLGQLITESISFVNTSGGDDTLFQKLDHHRRFVLNPRSHDNYAIPTYKSEIESAVKTLRDLRKIKIKPFLEKGKVVEFELSTGTDTYKFEIELNDDFRILNIDGNDSVITKGKITYWVSQNGKYNKDAQVVPKEEVEQYDTTTLKKFYDYNYKKSDKTKNSDFWETILIKDSGEAINVILNVS